MHMDVENDTNFTAEMQRIGTNDSELMLIFTNRMIQSDPTKSKYYLMSDFSLANVNLSIKHKNK